MIQISGSLELVCDRCLENYTQVINVRESLVLKPGEDFDDLSDDKVITYPRDMQEIDITQYIYEFIILAMPLKRVHENPELCNQEMLNKIESNNNNSDHYDPRWNELNKISYGTS